MTENLTKQETDRKIRTETARVVADIANRSSRLVRMVMQGEVENDPILISTVVYEQEVKKAKDAARIAYQQAKSELVKQAEKLVPFN